MTTMISPFEGTSSSNRIEIGGKAISLAIVKKSKFKSSFLCIPSTSLVNAKISRDTSCSNKSIPCKHLPFGVPFSREGETFCQNWEKSTKDQATLNPVQRYKIRFLEHPLIITSGRNKSSKGKETGGRINKSNARTGAIIKEDPSPD